MSKSHFIENKNNNQIFLYSVGGKNELLLQLDTVEIWYPDEGIWKEGPNLPGVRSDSGMVILDGMPTLLGGNDKFAARSTVYTFNSTNSEWVEMKALKVARSSAGYVAVPETMYNQC